MKAYVLYLPLEKQKVLINKLESLGFSATPNANGEGIIVLCDALPKALEPLLSHSNSLNQGSEKTVLPSVVKSISTVNSKEVFALDIPFEYRNIATKMGAHWDSALKGWFFEGTELPLILQSLKAPRFSWEDTIAKAKMNRNNGSFAGVNPYKLKPHQILAKDIIIRAYENKMLGFLLADDVGLGKTLSAWEGVQGICKEQGFKSIVIVCPLSVQAHWRDTIERQGSTTSQIVVLNYERLNKLFELDAGVKVKSKKGLAKRATAIQVDMIIFDESHKLKNPVSARSKLAAKLVTNSKFVLWLSATAGQTPLELSYLAPILAKATNSKSRDLNDFEAWCQSMGFKLKKGAFGAWEWVESKDDCDKLAELLFKNTPLIGLRRRPQDISGWPEISRILYPVELSSQQRSLYNDNWKDFLKNLQNGGDSSKTKSNKKLSINPLVEALRFRQKSSLLRVEQTFDFALDLLEEGIKPAISCAFTQTIYKLKELFEKKKIFVSIIEGSQSALQREQERLAFQKGQNKVIIFSIEEGISLHQGEFEDVPRSLLIHDIRWSAIQMAQIEGRTHRNGAFSQAYWLVAADSIEMKVASRVAKRTVYMKAMSGEVDDNLEKEIITELLKGLSNELDQ